MQPTVAIPPLTEPGVKKLVGQRCSVPMMSNPNKRWRVRIEDVRFINPSTAVCRIHADHPRFGLDKWVALSVCRWPNHIDDPLAAAIAKVRGEGVKQ